MTDTNTETPDAEKPVSELAKDTKDAVADRVSGLKEQASDYAKDAVRHGKEEVWSRADAAKGSAADEANRTAEAVRKAAGRFPEGDLRAQAAGQLADGLGVVAERIRDKDLGDIPADLTRFARRNPTLFFAGAAALGFAVARMAKATARDRHDFAHDDLDDDRGAA